MDLNKVMIIGRSTNNLQLKTIESTGTSVVNFTIATNRKYKNKDGNMVEDAEYHKCVAYGKGAEVLTKYLIRGKRVYVEGRLRTRKRQDSEGSEKFSTEIIVDGFIFLDSKDEEVEEANIAATYKKIDRMNEEIPF
jgi:single-strand DNA-binding protein